MRVAESGKAVPSSSAHHSNSCPELGLIYVEREEDCLLVLAVSLERHDLVGIDEI